MRSGLKSTTGYLKGFRKYNKIYGDMALIILLGKLKM
jgi:hypothetical protein